MALTLTLNGRAVAVESPADTPLLWVLRDELGLTGAKYGCGMGLCGACTVHVAGRPVRACVTALSAVRDQPIDTIEAVSEDRIGGAVQAAWLALGVAQCGYCQAGQIMSAVALLRATPEPSGTQIDDAMAGNLCRCGTYPRIRAAIQQAARQLREAS